MKIPNLYHYCLTPHPPLPKVTVTQSNDAVVRRLSSLSLLREPFRVGDSLSYAMTVRLGFSQIIEYKVWPPGLN